MKKKAYKRALLKISGESLKGNQTGGYAQESVNAVVERVSGAMKLGVEIALVVGAGNIWRGIAGAKNGMDRVTADQMGMLATAMNALCLKDAFTAAGIKCHVHSAVDMKPFAERFDRDRALDELSRGELVIFACGVGSPFFTTDTTAALRALEINADVVLKATKVNGIYTADPMKHPEAKRFANLTYAEAIEGRFAVMDSAAFSLCADNGLHIVVFNFSEPGALEKVLCGDNSAGTFVG